MFSIMNAVKEGKIKMDFRDFQARAKNPLTTGYMAMVFYKIAIRVSYLFAKTPLTPNQLTAISAIVAIFGATLIQGPHYVVRILGVVLWFLGYILDFCDGDIARYKDMKSDFGHWIEAVSDRTKDVGLYTSLTILAFRAEPSMFVVLFGMLALGGTVTYSYALSYGYMGTLSSGGLVERFGNSNYALMALFVVLDLPFIFLAVMAFATLTALTFKILQATK